EILAEGLMSKRLFGGLIALALAAPAHAVSLAVNPDKLTYTIGETITLTVTGDDAGTNSFGIFGRLDYGGALVDNASRTQTRLTGSTGIWITGVLLQGDNGVSAFSEAFNQIASPATDATNLPGTLSVVTLLATATGVVNVSWHTVPDGFELDFFGLTAAPGTTFTIV